jgi:two-component system NtrC family sensor kinase
VRLAVRDNGPGVPEALRPYIFDPFVTTKNEEAGEGTGLGLVMARAFAESAGGTLDLEDSAEGACFAFTFPACEPPPQGA